MERSDRQAEREFERSDRQAEREYELEKIRLENSRAIRESTPNQTDNSLRRMSQEVKKLMPKFNLDETDISLYLAMFERQARVASLDETEWASQLMALLPLEISQIMLRESEDNVREYQFVKELLLRRFQLSPETLRQKFVQHVRRPNTRWADFMYEIANYFQGWIEGLGVDTFDGMKELLICDQIKRKASTEIRDHFVDEWGKFTSPSVLVRKLDDFEAVRKPLRKPATSARVGIPDSQVTGSRDNFERKGRGV